MKNRNPFGNRHGSVMIYALVIISVGAVVLAGWAHSLAARTMYVEESAAAQQRRLSLRNSEALARQWILAGHSTNGVTATNLSVTVNGTNWGSFTISTGASNTLTTTQNVTNLIGGYVQTNRNPFSPLGTGGYVTNVTARVVGTSIGTDGTTRTVTNSMTYVLRSFSPLLAGFPLSAHTGTNATNFTGTTVITNSQGGSVLMYANASALSNAPASPAYLAPSIRNVVTTSGGSTLSTPISFPMVPLTSGDGSYSGSLSTDPPRSAPVNSPTSALANASTAFGTTPPTLAQVGMHPDETVGAFTFYQMGSAPGSTSILQAGTSRSPHMAIIGPSPGASARINNNRIEYSFHGSIYDLRYTSTGLQYQRDGNSGPWVPDPEYTGSNEGIYRRDRINPATELFYAMENGSFGFGTIVTISDDNNTRLRISGGTINPTGDPGFVPVPINPSTMTVLFIPPSDTLLTVHSSTVQIGGESLATAVAAIFYPGDYPADFGMLLLPNDPTAYQPALNSLVLDSGSDNYVVRGEVDGFPLVQLPAGSEFLFRDSNDISLASLNFQNPAFIRLTGEAASDLPVLIATDSVSAPVSGTASSYIWRRFIFVLDPDTVISTTDSTSCRVMSFLDPGLLTIDLEDDNNERSLALFIDGDGGGTTFTGGGTNTWNLSATVVDSDVGFEPGGDLTIVGGVRANSNVNVGINSVSLELNTSPAAVEPYADRVGWVEGWRQ